MIDKYTGIYKLIEKTWDSECDLKRFSTNAFNLDWLCIKTREVLLSVNRQKECRNCIQNILFAPETLETKNYLMLDGMIMS